MKPEVGKLISALKEKYPDAVCSLRWDGDPWRLLIAARLSAQCTDERVNIVTVPLFRAFPDVFAMAGAEVSAVEEIIRPCGLGHTKAVSCVEMSRRIVTDFEGEVPRGMDELLSLPGVGRKIANLVRGDVFREPGIVADTHCIRLNGRFGFYPESLKDPAKVETILAKEIPPEEQSDYCHRMVLFGRETCTARSPKCGECPIRPLCAHRQAE